MTEEDVPTMAPGLMKAYAPEEADESPDPRRRRRRNQDDPIANLRKWEPRTRLGAAVMAGKIITYEAALASGLPIREVEIVDALIPDLEDEVITVNMVQRYDRQWTTCSLQCHGVRRQPQRLRRTRYGEG
jgi:small subunit ribosomal protein S5